MTPRLTVATTFPIHPPRGGGQKRIHGLYRAVAGLGAEVEIVALVDRFAPPGRREIAPGVHELRVPRSAEHSGRDAALQQRAGAPVGDVALSLYHELTPAYGAALAAAAERSAAVVASHPYAEPALSACTDRPLVYEAHNVEVDLKAPLFEPGGAPELIDVVERVERACCESAELVLACSSEDAARLGERYGVAEERIALVPNGVDARAQRFVGRDERRRLKERLGLGDAFLVLFVGSWHEPNLVALRELVRAAPDVPDARFIVAGSAGLTFEQEKVPANVDLCGVVDDAFLSAVLALADAAVNPMRSGSGTNLKMLDYAAAGVPLLSTATGARGLAFEPLRHYAPIEADLAEAIVALRDEPAASVDERARAARALVEDRFDWRRIADRWAEHPWMRRTLSESESVV